MIDQLINPLFDKSNKFSSKIWREKLGTVDTD